MLSSSPYFYITLLSSQNLIIHFLTYNITVCVICVILANIRKRAFLLVIKVLALHVEMLLELQRRLLTYQFFIP